MRRKDVHWKIIQIGSTGTVLDTYTPVCSTGKKCIVTDDCGVLIIMHKQDQYTKRSCSHTRQRDDLRKVYNL